MNRKKRYKQKHKALGLCLWCPRLPVPGKKLCEKHLLAQRIAYNKYDESHRAARAEAQAKRRKQRIAEGRCPACGTPLNEDLGGYKYCINCRQRLFMGRSF